MGKKDLQKVNLDFLKGTVYKDMRFLGGNAYRDIRMSLSLGTSSDLVYYLKKHSDLLKGFKGNEVVEELAKGSFSLVYIIRDDDGKELVIKRSHDGWIPLQMGKYFYISAPRFFAKLIVPDFDVAPSSLKRDAYDYEKILVPFWGEKRVKLESEKFSSYLSMALHMVDSFLPEFSTKDLHSKDFWKRLLGKKKHKRFNQFKDYLLSIKTPGNLIPQEERYVFYDSFSNSLQTVFLQDAMRGKDEIIPGRKMAFPFELISHGVIPKEMPKIMMEHILRSIEAFVEQLDYEDALPKVPDFRPLNAWKVFPPTPYEDYFAETSNLVAYKTDNGKINVALVDTHLLRDPEEDVSYRWLEKRSWVSLFLNLRFWVRKAMESV